MTYGFPVLLKGFDFLIAVIGLFGIGEILLTMEEGLAFKGKSAKINLKVVFQTWYQLLAHWKTFLRSVAIGCWMGITPGGATPASFMSYGMARRMSKDPDSFGKGNIVGVAAPETAAHAAGTSALLPMLTLGIPGSPTAAVLLGGLLIWGLQPGPMLFIEQKDFVWGLIASMYLGNIVGLIVVLTTVPFWAAILRIPFSVIAPVIIVICAIGAYTVHSSMFDVADDAGVRRRRLLLQEAEVPAGADGAGAGPRRHGRGELPPVDAAVAGQPVDLLVQPAGRQHRRPRDHPAAVAADRRGARRTSGPRVAAA